MVESRNLAGVRIVRAELRPGPFLLRGIVVGKKQDFRVGVIAAELRRRRRSAAPLPARSSRRDRKNYRQDGSRKDRLAPRLRSEANKEYGTAIGLAGQRLPARSEIGVRLTVERPCESGNKRKNKHQQHLAHSESPLFVSSSLSWSAGHGFARRNQRIHVVFVHQRRSRIHKRRDGGKAVLRPVVAQRG